MDSTTARAVIFAEDAGASGDGSIDSIQKNCTQDGDWGVKEEWLGKGIMFPR